MHELPDGSGFFVGTVGQREPGLLNRVKYHKKGYARLWLFRYRMYRDARIMSRYAEFGPPMSRRQAFRYAMSLR